MSGKRSPAQLYQCERREEETKTLLLLGGSKDAPRTDGLMHPGGEKGGIFNIDQTRAIHI